MKVQFINLPKRLKRYKKAFFRDLSEIISNGDYILGGSVKKFENKIASFTKAKFCVGVNSGYDALFLSLQCIGIKEGDEIITVSNSYVATINAIINVGAKPVFVDIRDDLNMDIKDLKLKITKKTKAIIPVHLAGNPCELDQLLKVTKGKGIKIIEDCAQAFGANFKNKHVGNFGSFGCFSLHPAKNLHVLGDGGFIILNNKNYYNKLIKLRNHGHTSREIIDDFGMNSRLDTIQAAYALIMIKDFKDWQNKINKIADHYNHNITNKVIKPIIKKHKKSVYHNYILLVDQKIRKKLINFLKKKGIETRIHYPINFHEQNVFMRNFPKIKLRNTDQLSKKILSLPIYPEIEKSEYKYVVKI
ncbi:DegT/DnrJ/EryC1/StrS family aminotransferase, partial [Candidatus Pelagibacter sp.]|nr:DegT/DnrJ/EryC1/StrS family aminotransferase [Candidatus Pelagibacter sp.]